MHQPNEANSDAVAFVADGSNIEPQHNVPKALDCLRQHVAVTGVSICYQTTPLGPPGQALFVNGVWQIRTNLAPGQLITQVLHPIESQLGRIRSADRYAPRPIDLDLILYNDIVLQGGGVRLPHPDIERPFVWMPLLELLNAIPLDPILARNMRALLPSHQDVSDWGTPLGALTQTLRRKLRP